MQRRVCTATANEAFCSSACYAAFWLKSASHDDLDPVSLFLVGAGIFWEMISTADVFDKLPRGVPFLQLRDPDGKEIPIGFSFG